ERGQDLGASLAVTVDGEFALDLWGGWADEARSRRWQRDMITCVFSTTKTMVALAAQVLVERGHSIWTLRWHVTGPSSIPVLNAYSPLAKPAQAATRSAGRTRIVDVNHCNRSSEEVFSATGAA